MDSSRKPKKDPYASVYQTTTEPIKGRPKKPRRRDKSDLGDDFIAPDGGWAWLVCVAAGISNVRFYVKVKEHCNSRFTVFNLVVNLSVCATIRIHIQRATYGTGFDQFRDYYNHQHKSSSISVYR